MAASAFSALVDGELLRPSSVLSSDASSSHAVFFGGSETGCTVGCAARGEGTTGVSFLSILSLSSLGAIAFSSAGKVRDSGMGGGEVGVGVGCGVFTILAF